MSAHLASTSILTHTWFCRAFLLTLILIAFADCSEAYAFDYNDSDGPDPNAYGRSPTTPFVHEDRSARIGLMTDYARKQLPGLAPGLPSFLRHPSSWFGRGFGLNLGDTKNNAEISSVVQPLDPMPQSPSVDAPEALWAAPNYHHTGFLPLHDAMIMDVHLRHNLTNPFLSSPMQIDMHPFYGQNWHSIDNYWGTELALGLGSTTTTGEPWGKIALRFSSGHSDLLDRGHGIDMHTQLNFNEHLSFNAGIRENGNSAAGNYVMLRWKLVDGF